MIAVIGDVIHDEHLYCRVMGISPEDDVAPKLHVKNIRKAPGGAANVAANLRTMRLNVDLYGVVGNDSYGQALKKEFNTLIVCNHRSTTVKKRILTLHGKYICRIDEEYTNPILDDQIDYIISNISKYKIIIISDYNKGVITEDLLRRIPDGYIVDPKKSDWSVYNGARIIIPNKSEYLSAQFQQVTGKTIIVKMGGDGCMLDGKILKTRVREMGDPTGCGDSFLAGFTYGLWWNKPLEECCLYGNAAGACAFDHVGVYQVGLQELIDEADKIKAIS